MALLTVTNLSKAFTKEFLFQNLSFEVYENNKIGLIGPNGAGKTTLFRILLDIEGYDDGDIAFSKNTKIGYMEQHVCNDLEKTAYDEVLTIFSNLISIERKLQSIEEKLMGNPSNMDELIEQQMLLRETFERDGGLTYMSRARSALIGLGFTDEGIYQKVGVLSGGQKAKLQLAKLLLSDSNFMLLDEPTNHLDINAVEWLEDFLKNYKGAFLVISHDRYFLDNVTNRTFSLHNKRISAYKGNYSRYLELKKQDDIALKRKYDNTMKEIERLEGIVEQQRRWNREKNIRTAESKLKVIDRLKENLEKPESEDKQITLGFKASRRSGNDVFSCENLSLSFSDNTIFTNANMDIKRGEHIFLIGENGCGKTSFLKTILGIYKEDFGEYKYGTGVEVGYYDQIQSNLHDYKTVLDEVWDDYPEKSETEIRKALALFLFFGEEVYKDIWALSGGERARILLLKLMLSKANFLLLDEPTNHLDILSCEALEDALKDYEGTLLVVSHDRYLINKIADKIYVLSKDGTQMFEGNYDYYREQKLQEPIVKKDASPKPLNENKTRRELETKLKKIKKELSAVERKIAENEENLSALHAQLEKPEIAADFNKVMEVTSQIDEISSKNEEDMLLWEELAMQIEELENEIAL